MPFAGERNIVALHLWASGQRSWLREWPEDRWSKLARRVAGPDTLFLITGAPNDRPRTDEFVTRLQAVGLRCEAFVSPDGFRTLTHVLRRARVVISVNTGVMHLAAIAGAPTVAINGPNRNGRWGPVGPRAVGVEAPGDDCGYLHLGFEFDGRPSNCMERTTVDDVYAAVEALLGETVGAR
jgi:ADP-heptose:LPS heptosyltransferase